MASRGRGQGGKGGVGVEGSRAQERATRDEGGKGGPG